MAKNKPIEILVGFIKSIRISKGEKRARKRKIQLKLAENRKKQEERAARRN